MKLDFKRYWPRLNKKDIKQQVSSSKRVRGLLATGLQYLILTDYGIKLPHNDSNVYASHYGTHKDGLIGIQQKVGEPQSKSRLRYISESAKATSAIQHHEIIKRTVELDKSWKVGNLLNYVRMRVKLYPEERRIKRSINKGVSEIELKEKRHLKSRKRKDKSIKRLFKKIMRKLFVFRVK